MERKHRLFLCQLLYPNPTRWLTLIFSKNARAAQQYPRQPSSGDQTRATLWLTVSNYRLDLIAGRFLWSEPRCKSLFWSLFLSGSLRFTTSDYTLRVVQLESRWLRSAALRSQQVFCVWTTGEHLQWHHWAWAWPDKGHGLEICRYAKRRETSGKLWNTDTLLLITLSQ